MSTETRVPTTTLSPSATAYPWLREVGIVLAGTALVALCARVSIPLYFTPVPLTLQPFAILLLGLMLTPRTAAATMLAYLAEGAAGLPVFTPGLVGMTHLLGPTGGYLLAYPAAALLISWIWRRGGRSFPSALLSAAAGDLVILSAGALWLCILTHTSAQIVLTQAIVPFLPGEVLKVAAAAAIAAGWQRTRRPSTN